MKMKYFIVADGEFDFEQFKNLLNTIGSNICLGNNVYILSSSLENSKDIYKKITENAFNDINIVIVKVSFPIDFWGYADKSIWEFLSNTQL